MEDGIDAASQGRLKYNAIMDGRCIASIIEDHVHD
jgi:hypothetical protein